MLKYDRYYRSYGFTKVSHFTKPTLIETSSLIYPWESELFYYGFTDILNPISRNINYIKRPDKVFIRSSFEYDSSYVLGNPRKIVKPVEFLNKSVSKPELGYTFLKPNIKKTIPKNALLVRNFSSVGYGYKYVKNAYAMWFKFHNLFGTVLKEISTPSKTHRFLPIELPPTIPTIVQIEKFCKNMNIARLKSITSYNYFILLELWKFILPELRSKSMFNIIPEEERNNITLLFTFNNKSVIMNLSVFDMCIKEYKEGAKVSTESFDLEMSDIGDILSDYEVDIGSSLSMESEFKMVGVMNYKANVFKRLFYIMLNRIITATRTVSNDEENNLEDKDFSLGVKKLTKKVTGKKETKKVSVDETIVNTKDSKMESVLDTIIKDEVEIYNKKVDNEDDILGDKVEYKIEEGFEDEELDIDFSDLVYESSEEDKPNILLSKEQILTEKPPHPQDTLRNNINIAKKYGSLTRESEKKLLSNLENQKKKSYKIGDKDIKLDEILYGDTKQDRTLDNKPFTDNSVVFDKSYNNNTTNNFDKEYITRTMEKDTIRTIYSMQNYNNVIEEHTKTNTSNILEDTEEHTIKIRTLNGQTTSIKFLLPIVKPDGTFKMSGNSYVIRKQRTEIPIRKINPTSVVLNSYYGKVFIKKAINKKDDYGYWLSKQILARYDSGIVKDLVSGNNITLEADVPLLYSQLGRYISKFRFKDLEFSFKYKERHKYFEGDIKKIEQGKTICGKQGKNTLLMDKDNKLYSCSPSGGITNLPSIEELLDLDLTKSPIEFSSVKIGKSEVPSVVLLSYYLGLQNLLNVCKVKYEIIKDSKRPKKEDNQYVIKFKDCAIVIDRDYGLGDMILSGLRHLDNLENLEFKLFNDRQLFNAVFSYINLNLRTINEIKLLEVMFVDPMTKDALIELKEPTTFKGLLIRSNELLLDDNCKHPNNMEGQIIKGYERLNGMLYKSLAKAIQEHENRAYFSKSKIVMDPYIIMKKIKDDSSTVLVDNLNPLASIKQHEDVTYLGDGGRNEITMTKETRVYHPSEVGIISESVKDNGAVGITAYLSTNPSIANLSGLTKSKENKDLEWGDILSTSSLLMPFSIQDDGKRNNFIGIQSAHVVTINDMRPPYVRTGYEAVLPLRAGDKFVTIAEDTGHVSKITNNEVVVKYGNREVKYPLYEWTSKEESGSCYNYRMVTSLREGDKVNKDDTITYNNAFFQPDIFNRKRVIYVQGTVARVAIIENQETFEDSGTISEALSKKLSTKVTKVRSVVVETGQDIYNMVKVGQEVNPTDVLFTFMDTSMYNNGVDDKVLSILKDLKSTSPKAKLKGVVKSIIIYYNCDKTELSKTLRDLVEASDKDLIKRTGHPGRVNSSYSIRGNPLQANEIEIKIYIETDEGMRTGDKALFGNQLKFTVGNVFKEIVTEDGEQVDATFGFISIQNRIVNSPNLLGTTNTLMRVLEQKAIDMYFKD